MPSTAQNCSQPESQIDGQQIKPDAKRPKHPMTLK
jgi:hypothetical protein